MQCQEPDSKILRRLDEWKEKDGSFSTFVELYSQLLRLQAEVKSAAPVSKLNLPGAVIADRLKRGVSLLTFDDLVLHWTRVQNLFQAVTTVIIEHSVATLQEGESLREVASDIPLLQQTARAWYDH